MARRPSTGISGKTGRRSYRTTTKNRRRVEPSGGLKLVAWATLLRSGLLVLGVLVLLGRHALEFGENARLFGLGRFLCRLGRGPGGNDFRVRRTGSVSSPMSPVVSSAGSSVPAFSRMASLRSRSTPGSLFDFSVEVDFELNRA